MEDNGEGAQMMMIEREEIGEGAGGNVNCVAMLTIRFCPNSPSPFYKDPTILIEGGPGTTGGAGIEIAFSQILNNICRASSRAMHSILKEYIYRYIYIYIYNFGASCPTV